MSDSMELTIDTRAMEQALTDLGEKMARKVIRKALQAAGDTILTPMVALCPENTEDVGPSSNSLPPGVLKADLRTQVTLDANGGQAKIGPTIDTGHVARWINNGWVLTSHRKSGRHPIQRKSGGPNPIPGTHFIESAFDESARTATQVCVDTMAAGIAEAAQTGGAKNA